MCDFKMKEIGDLPDDVLLEVQRRLPPSDLKNATLVKRKWRAVGEHPTLWEKFTVTVYSKENITNLSIKRLRLIEEISINSDNWDVEDWKAFFRAMMGLPRLKKIDGLLRAGDGLELVEPSLFSKLLAKLEGVAVSGCTGDQIQALFSEMSISTKIKKLELAFCHLSQLEPGLFGKVLSRLEDLILTANGTTKDQMEAFLTDILKNSSLKRLVLFEESLRYLEPELFARALSKVEDVRLTDDGNAVPLEALFTELSYGTHQLKRLEVHGGDFTEVVPALVAHVLSRLEELSLGGSRISDDQVRALFTEMSHLTRMKKLRFEDVDLSQLEAGLFAKAMVGLEDLGLSFNDATAQQMVAFFTEVSRNSNLKTLDISYEDLSSVDPEVLAKAVTRLEAVTLKGTLSTEQVGRIFTCLLESENKLKKLDLSYIDAAAQVDPEIVRKVKDKLKGELKMTGDFQ